MRPVDAIDLVIEISIHTLWSYTKQNETSAGKHIQNNQ